MPISQRFKRAVALEDDMPVPRNETPGAKVFAFPLLGIALLLTCYWVLTDWQHLPMLISSALSSVYWPD
ncbi:MAG: hypothetical protein M3Y22_08040 [Pseudomonadota bacterium]|nr:hypothetical protein [Pseudomonadota bacterium]